MNKKWIMAGAIIIGIWLLVRMLTPNNQPERKLELGVMPIMTEKDVDFSIQKADDILQPLDTIRQDAEQKINAYR